MIHHLPHLNNFERPPLAPWEREGKVGLDKNEPPFSPADIVKGFFDDLRAWNPRTYPDSYALYEKLARHLRVDIKSLLVTFGSEQAIRVAFEIMIGPGDVVVYPNPAFAMIDVFANQFRAHKRLAEFRPGPRLEIADFLELIQADTRLVVLPNPNNPTGTFFNLEELRRIAQRSQEVGALFLVDEAYHPYAGVTALELIPEFPCVAVTRTFSKAWGLAGVRAGLVIAQPEVIRIFRKVKPIDEISTFSLAACLKALDHPEILKRNTAQVKLWKARFALLARAGVEPLPSAGNYVLLRLTAGRRRELEAWAAAHGYLLKFDMGHPCMEGVVRFCIGKDREMQPLFNFLAGKLPARRAAATPARKPSGRPLTRTTARKSPRPASRRR